MRSPPNLCGRARAGHCQTKNKHDSEYSQTTESYLHHGGGCCWEMMILVDSNNSGIDLVNSHEGERESKCIPMMENCDFSWMGHDSNGGIKLQPANVTLDLSKQGHSRKLLLCKVLEYLTVKEVLSTIIHVCKLWYLIGGFDQNLWKHYCDQTFGHATWCENFLVSFGISCNNLANGFPTLYERQVGFQQNNRKTLARRYLHDLQLWALNKKITDDEKQNVWTNCFWFRFYFQKRTMLELIYKKEESSFNLIHLMKHALQHYERSFQHDDLNQLTFLANLEKFKPQLQQGFVHSWLNSPYLYTEKHIRKGIKKWIMKHAIPTFFKVSSSQHHHPIIMTEKNFDTMSFQMESHLVLFPPHSHSHMIHVYFDFEREFHCMDIPNRKVSNSSMQRTSLETTAELYFYVQTLWLPSSSSSLHHHSLKNNRHDYNERTTQHGAEQQRRPSCTEFTTIPPQNMLNVANERNEQMQQQQPYTPLDLRGGINFPSKSAIGKREISTEITPQNAISVQLVHTATISKNRLTAGGQDEDGASDAVYSNHHHYMYSSSDDDDEYEEDELSHPSDGEYEVVDIGDDEDSCEIEDDLQQDEEEDPCESSIHLPLPTFETQFILDHHKSIQSNTKHTLLSFEECSGGYYHRENTSRESQVDKTNLKLLEDLFFNPSSLGDNDSEYKQFVNHAIENKLLYYYLLVVLCGNIGLGVLNN